MCRTGGTSVAVESATELQAAAGVGAGVLRGVLRVVGAAPDSSLPNLSGIRLESADGILRLDGTNLEWGVQARVPWGGPALGPVMVDGRLLERLVASWDPEAAVELEAVAEGLWVRSGESRVRLVTAKPDDWPEPKDVPEPCPSASVEAQELARALRRVLPATDPRLTASRPALGSVRIEVAEASGLTLVATDAARLHYDRLGGLRASGEGAVLVPASSVQGLLRVLDAAPPKADTTLLLGDRVLAVEVGAYRYWTRLAEASYPSYGHVLAEGPDRVTLPVRPLADAVQRLSLLAPARQPAVVGLYAGEGNYLLVRATAADRGDGEEQVPLLGGEWPPDLVLHYQARFLADALACAETDRIELSVERSSGRAVVFEESRAWRAVMMSWRTG